MSRAHSHDHGFHHHETEGRSGHQDSHGAYGAVKIATPPIVGDKVKIFSEADTGFNLGVRGDEVVMLPARDSDPYQEWIKDESWGTKAKDSAGLPAFALINVGSGKALKRAAKMEDRVSLENYHKDLLNEAVLWTISTDHGKKWHALRPVGDISMNLDIENAAKEKVHDGHHVLLFNWKDGDNQHWQIAVLGDAKKSEGHHLFHH